MATIAQLRSRSESLFTQLLEAQVARPRRRQRFAAAPRPDFIWFDARDAVGAATLSFRLAAHAASRKRVTDGLRIALDHVDEEMARDDPERVRQGFALFVTHNRDGRRLLKPRTVAAAPRLFSPPRAGQRRVKPISIGGLSPGLDYWREDPLANEHHQHWHEVYPYTGLPPRSFAEWLSDHTTADLVAILNALRPDPGWDAFVRSQTPEELAALFARVVQADAVILLPQELYTMLFRLNDRQGELFFYMHEQMLARYDAELLSNELARVEPFEPADWKDPIAPGHDPIELQGYGRRRPNETLPAAATTNLRLMWQEIDDALESGSLRAATGGTIAIDRTNLGEAVEATVPQLRTLDPASYQGLHGSGHVSIARLSTPGGVMRNTVTAIRDQIFWQWHKFIDDISATWQDTLTPFDFDDAPNVLLRDSLGDGPEKPWASPDIVLCRTVDLPTNVDPNVIGEELFGGENWSKDFTSVTASTDAISLQTLAELTTTMATATFGGQPINYLTHEPFSYFLRIENRASTALDVTVRIFLAPAAIAVDRRSWIEMDKFLLQLPAASRIVAYRPDTESSVVKRPIEKSPAAVTAGGGDPEENSYCDCGWPYTLLLPRGTDAGMDYRLLVLCTDAAIDGVGHAEHCGSMSYCGAVDRYPDTRDMGFPFCRPFAGTKAKAIRETVLALPSAAARTLTIRHV